MKTTTSLFPLRSALLCLLLGLTPRFPLSAAEPTALPAPVSSTAADGTTPVVAPAASTLKPFIARPGPTAEATSTVASSTLSPFIARPVPATAATASPDTTKTTNPADKPQYVFTWFLNNYLGTTIASSNAAEEIAEIETDAFGAPLARGTLPADMRYTGKPYDEDMGAYIFPFRNYRPDEARWMTQDPSGFPDGPNNRMYAALINLQVDALGLDSKTISYSDAFADSEASFSDGSGIEFHFPWASAPISQTENTSNATYSATNTIYGLTTSPGWFIQEVFLDQYMTDASGVFTETHLHWLEGAPTSPDGQDTFSTGVLTNFIAGGSPATSNTLKFDLYGSSRLETDVTRAAGLPWTGAMSVHAPGMYTMDLSIPGSMPFYWISTSHDATHRFDLWTTAE